jgi:monoamine oxidase
MDGRIVLAGDHVSDFVAWQEGALVSSLEAIQKLHQKALA